MKNAEAAPSRTSINYSPLKKKRPKTSRKQPRMVSYQELKEIERKKQNAHNGPGAHDPYKDFGQDLKTKVTFGGKYKWKPDNNPPPGIYDPNDLATKSNAPSVKLGFDRSVRSDFTQTPMKENPSGGNYQKVKEFGSDIKTKVTFGSKYKWKPDNNPPPGLYEVQKGMGQTKPKISTTSRLDVDRSKRSDFTKTAQQEIPGGGTYEIQKPFGSDNKSKMTFGGKYRWKPDSNPPPGLYDPNNTYTKPNVKSVVLSPDKTKRTDFTDTPMKEIPDAGLYDRHLKEFGASCKTKINFGSKYKQKYDNNPPVGIYNPDNAMSATLPRTRSTVIKKDSWKRSKFTESPTRDNPDAGYYNDHLKPFGSGLKNPMTRQGHYDFKPNDNPPPGLYDLDASSKHTKPKVTSAVIKDVARYPVFE